MDKLNAIGKQLAAIWKRISFNQRVSIVLVAVVALLGLWMFAKLANRPSMARLYPHALDPGDAAEIAEKLRGENVTFQIRSGGAAIYVPSSRVDELRLVMAGAGLPANTGGTGWGDIFDKGGMSADSDTLLNIKKLRALQGELARTISSLSSVQSARVHLVTPRERIFPGDQEPTTASVVLNLRPGGDLGPSEVNGIKYFCASAIAGLKPNNITILDGDGNVLAKPKDDDSLADMSTEHIAMARNYEADYQAKARAQLDSAFGPGNSSVVITVELNTESEDTESVVMTEGAMLTEESVTRTVDNTDAAPGGLPGTGSNLGGETTTTGSGGSSSEKEETIKTASTPNKTTTRKYIPAGSIKRVSASVIVNTDRGEAADGATTLSTTAVEELVKRVIAYDETRGDQVSVHEASFVPVETGPAQVASMPNPIITGIAKHGPAAIISIGLLGFLWVAMKKTKFSEPAFDVGPMRAAPAAAGASGGTSIGAHVPDAMASDKRVQQIFEEIVLEDSDAELRGMREAMSRLAEQKPESVAAVIREWIS